MNGLSIYLDFFFFFLNNVLQFWSMHFMQLLNLFLSNIFFLVYYQWSCFLNFIFRFLIAGT